MAIETASSLPQPIEDWIVKDINRPSKGIMDRTDNGKPLTPEQQLELTRQQWREFAKALLEIGDPVLDILTRFSSAREKARKHDLQQDFEV